MDERCVDPTKRGTAADAEAQAAHADRCPACRVQWDAHREMTALFAGAERPRLGPEFNALLKERLISGEASERGGAPAESPWPRRALRLYWAAAGLASLWIASRFDWRSALAALTPAERAGSALVLLALPLLLLAMGEPGRRTAEDGGGRWADRGVRVGA